METQTLRKPSVERREEIATAALRLIGGRHLEIPLCEMRRAHEARFRGSAGAGLDECRLLVPELRAPDRHAHESLRDAGGPVARSEDRTWREWGDLSKCPFSEMVQEMSAPGAGDDGIPWTPEAVERLGNIPEFVRPMARTGIEKFARDEGADRVDEQMLDRAKEFFGM